MVKMQNVAQGSAADNPKLEKVNVHHDIGNSSTPHSATSSPAKSETETYSEHPRFMSDSSESEEDSVSEVESFIIDRTELDEDPRLEKSKFLLSPDDADRSVDPETQARLEALLHAAGISQLATKDGKHLADPEVLRRLTSSVSCALDEAAAALTRMRTDNPRTSSHSDKTLSAKRTPVPALANGPVSAMELNLLRSLVEACTDGDVGTVRKLLTEGRSVHETTEDGESLLSLACSAGYFELAQVLLAMHANVEDRGIKGECTPLMEAASAGHIDIVRLLIAHGADVNAQSTSGNTPLMYACAGGHEEAVETLLEAGANVEDHNENGHTPLMEAASAGHVNVAKILLGHGAGINTHSNEFKESALTLACYKGHLDMVRFLLEAGADQEHKTDEMHTALMEASMDGHVEVARLLLDSGAQVNMPTDSFESPLTLAACGGHVDLAMLLIERGANIEEVNDEGYTPLMEAAREGHEEMVALLLSQGANINAQTDETQETALTLACCGGFSEVADFLIKAGADIELGASTPLMEAAQEGHLELVKYLLQANANVHAQTQTGDTALTYACENGHTDVADLLLECNADLEHESEGGRTPLMKACRAGHLCTVQFLISKGANVNRQTTNNDHTPLSLACAGGHLAVVELLLSHQADPFHKLKDNSTMLIEAAKGGHTSVVQLLLDYPHSILMTPSHQSQPGVVSNMMPTSLSTATPLPTLPPTITVATQPFLQGAAPPGGTDAATLGCQGLHEVPEAVRIVAQDDGDAKKSSAQPPSTRLTDQFVQQQQQQPPKHSSGQKSLLRKNHRSAGMMFDGNLTSAEAQQVRTQPLGDLSNELGISAAAIELLSKEDGSILDKGSTGGSIVEYIKARRKQYSHEDAVGQKQQSTEEHILQKQQILEELHRVERELQVKAPNHLVVNTYGMGQGEALPGLPGLLNIDLASHTITATQGMVCGAAGMSGALFHQPTPPTATSSSNNISAFYAGKAAQCQQQAPVVPVCGDATFVPSTYASPPAPLPLAASQQPPPPQVAATWPQQTSVTAASAADVSQNTAISDRPKAKPVSKKEGKNLRKQQAYQAALQQQQHLQQINQQLQQQVLQQQQQLVDQQQSDQHAVIQQAVTQQTPKTCSGVVLTAPIVTHILEQNTTATQQQQKLSQQQQRILQASDATTDLVGLLSDQDSCHLFTDATDKTKLENVAQDLDATVDDVVQTLETFSLEDVANVAAAEQEKLQMAAAVQQAAAGLQVQSSFPSNFDDTISAIAAAHTSMQVGTTQTDVARVEYFAVPTSNTQLPALQVGHGTATGLQLQYEQYLQSVAGNEQVQGAMYQAGFQAGLQLCQEMHMSKTSQQLACSGGSEALTTTIASTAVQSQVVTVGNGAQYPQPTCTTHQVQVATQTQQQITPASTGNDGKKQGKAAPTSDIVKVKKGRLLMQRQQPNHLSNVPPANGQFAAATQNFQIDPNTGQQYASVPVPVPVPQTSFSCMDVDSETDSNHDTALTLACAGGHEDLVELLLQRGADIEHRDKKGFTPLILAATAGHEKVVEILLNHGADIEAQSERTKDTPLSLACSGGRYEVVDLLLSRGANREHRNVSDYTPLSLAASGGYVNIIKLLLNHGAEINSRTGSKLGISPLMLAAMNGHTAAVKLLLDMGSDINAQIETNRNTALTLACFQGRHEVVSLLLDRKANVEHRAKTGLTPLMEAASGGYVEVGRVLLDKGADVNATPVPSSRDTALTIAADKGHCRFVELLLTRGAAVEVKNKKGNSPLWLAANGGHISVVELLYNAQADIDSQDNRKVSCLMAAFRKGHTKVVKWMVNHVTQFPSDQEMIRYISTVSDKELLEKCQECVKIIRAAKETQAAKANKNASILLEELDQEKNREESKKAAAARRRERKKKKKLEKKEEKRKLYEENRKNETYDDKEDKKSSDEVDKADEEEASGENTPGGGESPIRNGESVDKEEGDSGIDANSQGSCSSNDVKSKEKRKDKKKKKNTSANSSNSQTSKTDNDSSTETLRGSTSTNKAHSVSSANDTKERLNDKRSGASSDTSVALNQHSNDPSGTGKGSRGNTQSGRKGLLVFESSRHPAERDEFEATGNENYVSAKGKKSFMHYENDVVSVKVGSSTSPKQSGKREEGWKEVVRKSSVQTVSSADAGTKKVSVPLNAISRVIGRGGSNINAIRGATGAHIEVEKQSKGQGERIITIKGSAEATKQAHSLIGALIKDPDVDILQMLPKTTKTVITSSLWDKTNAALSAKKNAKIVNVSHGSGSTSGSLAKAGAATSLASAARSAVSAKPSTTYAPVVTRGTAPRLVAAAEKRVAAQLAANTKNTMSYTTAIMTAGRGSAAGGGPAAKPASSAAAPALVMTQTFAAKLTDSNSTTSQAAHQLTSNTAPSAQATAAKTRVAQTLHVPHVSATAPTSPQANVGPQQTMPSHSSANVSSPKHHHRPLPTASAPPSIAHYQQQPGKAPFSVHTSAPTPAQDIAHIAQAATTPITSSAMSAISSTSHPTVQPPHSSVGQATHAPEVSACVSGPSNTTVNTLPPVSASSTPQEYSLFNDSFTKVTQQMWGRENDSHKPINFAAVTGGNMSSQPASVIAPPKFIDNDPPQIVDASKAPGYRGTAVCSPVSSKTSSNSTTPPTMPLAPGTSYHNFPEQPKSQPIAPLAGINLNRPVSRPGVLELGSVAQTSPLDHYVARGPPVYQQDMPVRSTGQSVDSNNLYKSVSSASFTAETTTNLLKMVPGGETQQPHGMIFHQQTTMQHHMNFSQPQPSGGQMNNNSTVSMSRLNPRAPDFSLHNIANKQQTPQPVTMFNTAGYHHTGVISANQGSGPNTVIGSGNIPYPLKSSLGTYRSNSGAGQNRWQFMGPPSGYHPQQQQQQQQQQQPDVMMQMNHLRGMGLTHPPMDLLENGGMNAVNNSPAMSPNSPAGHNLGQVNTGADGHHKMEDRKIPQPIGIERAWKIQNSNVPTGADTTDINWILGNESKIAMGTWNSSCLAPNMDRQPQFFRNSYRMPTGDEITHMMDSYQHGNNQMDNQHVFQNGTVAAMGLMPGGAVAPLGLQQQYGGPVTAQDLIQTAAAAAAVAADPMKIGEMPQWDGGRMAVTDIQDKHGWTAKWSQ